MINKEIFRLCLVPKIFEGKHEKKNMRRIEEEKSEEK